MRCFAALLLFASLAYGQTVKLPAEVKAKPGRLVAIAIEHDGDECRYDLPPEVDAFREYDADPKSVRLRILIPAETPAGSKFRLLAVCVKGGKLSPFSACVIVVDGPPVPPVPPTPPKPLVPVDPFTQKVVAAWVGDADPVKKEHAKDLADIYAVQAANIKSAKEETCYSLFQHMHAARLLIFETGLASVRAVLQAEMDAHLPTTTAAPLDDEAREKCRVVFTRIASALQECAK